MNFHVTPRGLARRAAMIGAAFLVAHLAGLRDHASFLSGTASNASLGVIYVCLYFGAVLVAPPLAIGAGVFALLERVSPTTTPGEEPRPDV